MYLNIDIYPVKRNSVYAKAVLQRVPLQVNMVEIIVIILVEW